MSFGYSVGDIVLLGQLAWKAYKSCKDAPESFKNISHEVLSLHALLKEIEENLSAQTLSLTRQARLKTIGDGCYNVLEELQSLIDKYKSLGTQSKRTWDRMKWGSTDIADTTQIVVEKKLDEFLQEFQNGKHEGSVVTTQTAESLSTDEKQTWRIIRKELEDIGITVAAFDANRDFIMNWFIAAIANGDFEEQTLDASSSQTCEDDLDQLWEDPQYPTVGQSVTGLVDPLTIQNTPTRDPVTLEAQSTQIVITQKATSSPTFLPTDELSTGAKTLHMQVTQKVPRNAPTRRERVPRVAALIAWVLGYNKELINAARQGQETVVQQLLEKGADVNAKDGYHKKPALHWAAQDGHEAVVRLLLEKGADVNAKNSYENTALHWAAQDGHEAV
ncbi:hypothetical protein FGG08_005991, partial [Glutinoglossum americanum]